jgi:hypothetical protein
MRKPTSNTYATFQNLLLSGNKNQKGGVSLKVVKDTIAEQ